MGGGSLTGPVAFFGTPEFAVPTLEALVEAGVEIGLVVSQPDRRAGRGGRLSSPPVAETARRLGVELAQPERVRQAAFRERLAALGPSLAVVVAFGQIFPAGLLRLPVQGCVNLHASLLPRWRGASPISAAIAGGDRITGVTTMVMERGLDSGPILEQREVAIGERETTAELAPRLARVGAALMVETVARLAAGELEPRPQDASLVTHAPMLTRADGRVDWSLPAGELFNRLRAFTPWPGLHAEQGGRPVKLLDAEPLPGAARVGEGIVAGLDRGLLLVGCGGGTTLGISRLQRPGGRSLTAADFVNGERLSPGDRFD